MFEKQKDSFEAEREQFGSWLASGTGKNTVAAVLALMVISGIVGLVVGLL